MARFIPFTREQIERANNVDLAEFLRSRGEAVKKSGKEWRWDRHDSVTIDGNEWYRHSEQRGGNAIDFVKEFYDLPFPEAVTLLLDGEGGAGFQVAERQEREAPKEFSLPEPHRNARRVYAYLSKARGIDPSIVTHFVRAGTLYEDVAHHNAVFVGQDENSVPRHGHKKSTYSFGQSYRGNVAGSDARYGFAHIGTSDRLYIFEAPIDMMAFISLYQKDWQQHSYLTLNGVSNKPVEQALKVYPQLRHPVFCLDNDAAGREAIRRNSEKLKELGYEASQLLPYYKDWGEQLQIEKGILVGPEQEISMELGP